jgi:rhodanese-related sulfurtransferase
MQQKGITNAAALLGGTAAWKGAKYPMELSTDKKGTKPPEE